VMGSSGACGWRGEGSGDSTRPSLKD
jgi:hypothetical protein